MGQDWTPNKAIMIELLVFSLETANLDIQEATSMREKDQHWISFHTYVVICYVLSLRLITFKTRQGFITGPAISDFHGRILSHRSLNHPLLDILEDLFNIH
jgi:hypothetical protein